MKTPTSLLVLEMPTVTLSGSAAATVPRLAASANAASVAWACLIPSSAKSPHEPQGTISLGGAWMKRHALLGTHFAQQPAEPVEQRIEPRELVGMARDGAHHRGDSLARHMRVRDQQIEHARLIRVALQPAQRALSHGSAAVIGNGAQHAL